jgi:soluble lytic murein transglycosylase
MHDYLMPYSEYLHNTPIKRKILIFSLARQESHFIPTEVSYSYALGMMQFMPFVAKEIAKKQHIQNFQYEEMFKPKVAYQFANIHLDFLEKTLTHPLFIAYAYNAGIGFTKRQILSKDYFKKAPFEPFWSLEMVPNAQARKYGKRVLANYAIYAKLLGVDITLHTLLKTIK